MIEKYIRLAKTEDIPDLIKLSKSFHKSSPYRTMGFDATKTKTFFENAIATMGMQSVTLVALKDEKIVGFLAATASEPVFSASKISMEMAWWVEPEHRGSRSAYLLFKAYEDWALRVGCSYVQMAYLPDTETDLDEFYRKQGYQRVESSYLKRLNQRII